MIEPIDLFNINYYKSQEFNGSYKGMRYRIEKHEDDDGKSLLVTVWPGPFNYDTTTEEKKFRFSEEFSNDGLKAVVQKLNEIWERDYQ